MMPKLFFVVLFLNFLSCKTSSVNDTTKESQIINDCFLEVVDTFAYKYRSLRPAPNDTVVVTNDSLTIGVYNRLTVPLYWGKSVFSALAELSDKVSDKEKYVSLFNKSGEDTIEKELLVTSITNKGKYRLIPETNKNIRKVTGRIGSLVFSRVYFDQDAQVGFFTIKIQDNIKSGIEKLILLKKHNNTWEKKMEIVIDNW